MHISKKRDLCFCLAWIACGNFVLFITFAAFAGGFADHTKNGHYYLSNRGHVTEVSAPVYRFAQLHMWVTFPLILFAPFALKRGKELQHEIGDYDPVTSRGI
jgi:hypothetical protein